MKDGFKTSLGGFAVLTVLLAVGPQSAEAYCDASMLGPVNYGQSNIVVKAFQQCLIDAGYSVPAGATGYYGSQTQAAVKQFYREALFMSDWDGNSVGPIGRSKLVSQAQGGGVSIPAPVIVPTPVTVPVAYSPIGGYKKLSNAEELKKYVTPDSGMQTYSTGLSSESVDSVGAPVMAADTAGLANASSIPSRVSETNVQIVGIDEPDIIKTDGKNIFVSRELRWYNTLSGSVNIPGISVDEMTFAPNYQPKTTAIVKAFPLDDLAVVSKEIEETGEMLLVKEKDLLIIFSRPNIVAYDVRDTKNPDKEWELSLNDDTEIVTSRLIDDTVYLVTQTQIDRDKLCPVVPIHWKGGSLNIPCRNILVPETIEPVSYLYTVMKVDTDDGSVVAKTSMAGDYRGVTVMMTENDLYLASQAESAQYQVMSEILIEGSQSYLPESVIKKAKLILSYEISEIGKVEEISNVLEEYLSNLSDDESLKLENDLSNKFEELLKSRLRDMSQSRIVRISLDTLTLEASASVPGSLMNQFAMDEYEGHLRVAVTVGDRWGGAESVNDVYVLDKDLKVTGKIQDLGLSERIYAVRFMGDKGYLVTFRQIDPFYVLNLSDPDAPKMSGELKIPGYSAYLEPLGNDLVLGVGREGSGVKLSIFDVSNPLLPVEKSKYILKDYWSEIENNHHAFLRDDKHEIFFIPGNNGGYIFSYQNGKLVLKKALSGYGVKRALYIDDYLYVISEDKIRVLDENDWEEVKTLDL